MTTKEQQVRELVPKVYGEGATVEVDRTVLSGWIDVYDADGEHIVGWFWDSHDIECKTEEQAWETLLGFVREDEAARRAI